MTEQHKTLAGALAAAILDAGAVEKSKRNDYHRYAYASAESILAEARGALARNGLVAHWSERKLNRDAAETIEIKGRKGSTIVRVYAMLEGVVRVRHANSAEMFDTPTEWPVCLEAGKGADKAVAAASTSALSYALRDLLLLPRVAEGEDIQSRHDEVRPPEPAKVNTDPQIDEQAKAWLQAFGMTPSDVEHAYKDKLEFADIVRHESWSRFQAKVTAGEVTADTIWGATPREAAAS